MKELRWGCGGRGKEVDVKGEGVEIEGEVV